MCRDKQAFGTIANSPRQEVRFDYHNTRGPRAYKKLLD